MVAAGVIAPFELPSSLEAAEPPEARGLARDEVRLLVSDLARDTIEHARFRDLPHWLAPGDVLVVNTSGTLPAALPAIAGGGQAANTRGGISRANDYDLHLSTRLGDGLWIVELRRPDAFASSPCRDARPGMLLLLPDGAHARMIAPYPPTLDARSPSRLWKAQVSLTAPTLDYLARHGFPIRYRYVPEPWPLAMYQTVFATEPGSAEMPSAGRPFTPGLVTRLISRGVQFAPLLLHTGSPVSRITSLPLRSSIASLPKPPPSSAAPAVRATVSSPSGRPQSVLSKPSRPRMAPRWREKAGQTW